MGARRHESVCGVDADPRSGAHRVSRAAAAPCAVAEAMGRRGRAAREGMIAVESKRGYCVMLPTMRRLLLAFCICTLPATTASAADLLLAINKGDQTLAIVDAATLKVLGTAPTGPDPHEVIASADGKFAYITNYNAGNGFANSLSVVDLVAMKALPPIDLGALGRPHGIALADGKVYFTAEGAKVVGRYDPATRRVDLVIGSGQDRTHMVIVSSDQKTLFTTNVSSATVSIFEQFTVTRRGGPPPAAPAPGAAARGAAGRGAGPGATDWRVTVVPVG